MTDHEIFSACFPQLRLTEALWKQLTDYDSCTKLRTRGGFAMINKQNIVLLAVHPDYRRRGVGSALLSFCESIISDRFDSAVLGGSLFCGAVSGSYEFFEKHGYSPDREYCEMCLDLSDYADRLPEASAAFDFYNGMDTLRAAVNEVDKDWVQYFYGSGEDFCGFTGSSADTRRPVSFCIFEDNVDCVISDGISKVGSIGCVGTIPAARGKGTGLKMVSLAACELKKRGCNKCFIHWTHLESWYAKLGAVTAIRFRCGKKSLKHDKLP